MPATDTRRRPSPVLLGLLGVVLVAGIISLWPAASPSLAPSNQPRDQRPATTAAPGRVAPGQLDVRLEALKEPPPEPDGEKRNPFRFYVKPPPPKPVVATPPAAVVAPPPQRGEPGYVEPPPLPPPPITLKFIGTLEVGKKKVAIFSDGRGLPMYAQEGELVLGQYRVVRIQAESVVMEYANGKGRQTIPMRGGQ